MGAFPVAVRTGLTALVVAGLVAAAAGAVAAGSTAAAAAPAAPTSPVRTPAATAPPIPVDHGPPCTTDTDKPYPVICLPAGSGEDKPASLAPGDTVEFDAQVVNNGPAVADAEAVITLPAGLTLESDEDDPVYRIDDWYQDGGDDGEYTDLTCRTDPSTITCRVGALAARANILVGVDLQVADNAAPLTTLTLGVALQPAGTDSYPTTSVTARIDVLEPSTLVASLTPATLRTVVGHRATMTGTVHNDGPGAAPDTVAVAIAVDGDEIDKTHFAITNGLAVSTVGSTTLVLAGRPATPVRARLQRQALRHHQASRHQTSLRRHALPSSRFWPLGTIAAGATARISIRLAALSVGTDTLTFGALSPASASNCAGGGESATGSGADGTALARSPAPASTITAPSSCPFVVQTRITAIRRPVTPAPLADTGSGQLAAQLAIALAALMLGSLFLWLGRRRGVLCRTCTHRSWSPH